MATLTKFNQLRSDLAKIATVDEAKGIRDKAEAMRVYYAQVKGGLEMQNNCAEIKIRAERRAGELLKAMEKHKGGRPSGNRSHDATGLGDLGLNKSQSSRWQATASVPHKVFEGHIAKVKAAGDRELTSTG
ncbi:MAG: hypothetical protein GY842_19015 [bacterium]|nr:hypothetical protein [bacterium]